MGKPGMTRLSDASKIKCAYWLASNATDLNGLTATQISRKAREALEADWTPAMIRNAVSNVEEAMGIKISLKVRGDSPYSTPTSRRFDDIEGRLHSVEKRAAEAGSRIQVLEDLFLADKKLVAS